MKTNRKGFTLIELMIVVAIIGILAAVAIPGFMRYIKSSKTTEAQTNLKSIADGASSWFQAEHASDTTGLNIYTKSYPGCESTGATVSACTSSKIGVAPAANRVGLKNPITATEGTGGDAVSVEIFKAHPWDRLKFSISKPFYYHYSYGTAAAAANAAGISVIPGFSAGATAALSNATDNSTIKGDSAFQIVGNSEGIIGAIVDVSDSATKAAVSDDTGLFAATGS